VRRLSQCCVLGRVMGGAEVRLVLFGGGGTTYSVGLVLFSAVGSG
jgi:hypothetical protein